MMQHPLKIARIEKHLTQREAGALIGVSWQAFRKYETGERHPRPDEIIKIKEVFGIEPNQIYEFIEASRGEKPPN